MPAADRLPLVDFRPDPRVSEFCRRFFTGTGKKYLFGWNEYASSIMQHVRIDGVIDEYTQRTEIAGIPVTPLESVPVGALIVSVVVGKPFVAEKKIARLGCEYLDYFALLEHAPVPLRPVIFQQGMREDIKANRQEYEWLFSSLADDESRRQLVNILNFRLSADLRHMRGFSPIEHLQYFEAFLEPWGPEEVFADVGAFDGQTTLEFVGRVPNYQAVHVFEPIPSNMGAVRQRLSELARVQFHQIGLGSQADVVTFSEGGSCSRQDEAGSQTITVERLDSVVKGRVTFIKMDIEGGEAAAIEGAAGTISREHPRLAIAAYHGRSDLWKLARQVMNIRADYRIYLRHYTEGVAETDLFFVPDPRLS